MTKDFLTLEQVKQQGLKYCEYQTGVYKYRKDNKWTLVEDGVELFNGFVYDICWYEEGVYYLKDGKWTLLDNTERKN